MNGNIVKTCHIAPGQTAHHMRIYHRFCWSLAKAGHEVMLLAQADGQPTDNNIDFHNLEEAYTISLKLRLRARIRRNIRAYRQALNSGAHFYIFYSPEFIPWALLLKWRTGKPVVFDCMEDFEGYARQRPGIPEVLRGLLTTFVRFTLKLAAKHLDAITVADIATEDYFKPYAKRVITIHNFPRLEFFPASGYTSQPEFDLVYHGSFTRYLLELILAIDQSLLAKGYIVKWYLFGNMLESESLWFETEINQRKSSDHFYLGKTIPHDKVASEVMRARIGIIPLPDLPKYHKNIPQKLFEFMALGIPVIVSGLPPISPFVGDNSDGATKVNPITASAFADAIKELLDNPMLYQKMRFEGKKRIEQYYNWEKESLKLLNLVKELSVSTEAGTLQRA